jgi:purine-binding chemotaxis protein CheW
MQHFLEFQIDDFRLALALDSIIKVEQAAEIRPLPGCPPSVHGIIDFHGRLVPVLNLREKFYLKPAELRTWMFFILVKTKERLLALIADSLGNVISCDPVSLLPGTSVDQSFLPDSLMKTSEGVLLICDPDKFLNSPEKIELEKLMDSASK